MQSATFLFLGFIIVQRLSELAIAKRNTRRLIAEGAVEVGANHYPYMVMLHSAWLACLVIFGYSASVSIGWLVVFAALQILRVWILTSLGGRWTTRIIILDKPLVKRGPFKYFSHPNYMLVVIEIFVAPMVLGLVWLALLFSILNAAMLWVRIGIEHEALAPLRDK